MVDKDEVKSIWYDNSLLNTATGIANDGLSVLDSLNSKYNIRFLPAKYYMARSNWLLRKVQKVLFLLFSNSERLPPDYSEIFYQPQVNSIIPGKGIKLWMVRIHDIFPITTPEWFRRVSHFHFRKAWNLAAKNSAIFVCSSHYTKNQILKHFPYLNGRIEVVPCIPRTFSEKLCGKCSGCVLINSNLTDKKFFIAVGTVEPRKNYKFLLESWISSQNTRRNDSQLLIVGRRGWKVGKLLSKYRYSNYRDNDGVIWLEFCCDGALSTLYTSSTAFISCSLDEGFNLPALEAREIFKLPLVLSDIQVHRELHSDFAHFFSSSSEFIKIINLIGHKKSSSVNYDYAKIDINKNNSMHDIISKRISQKK